MIAFWDPGFGLLESRILPCEQRSFNLPRQVLFPTYLGRSKSPCSQGTGIRDSKEIWERDSGLHFWTRRGI